MAASASSRSARVSPIPTRIPVVKGMASSPAASRVASRRAGSLVWQRAWGPPGSWSRSESDSSIMPWPAQTRRRAASSSGEQGAGVGVGQQAGLVEHQPAAVGQVLDGRAVPELGQRVAGHRVALLGPLPEGEQGLVAAGGRPRPGDLQHLLWREVGRGPEPGRGLGEGAVAAVVAAEHGEGDEDLGRVGDPGPVTAVADPPGLGQQLVQRGGRGDVHTRQRRPSLQKVK